MVVHKPTKPDNLTTEQGEKGGGQKWSLKEGKRLVAEWIWMEDWVEGKGKKEAGAKWWKEGINGKQTPRMASDENPFRHSCVRET